MGSVAEHQREEKTSRFPGIQSNRRTDRRGLEWVDKRWEWWGFFFVSIHPESYWGKDVLCTARQLLTVWPSELSHTVCEGRGLLFLLAAHLCVSSRVKRPIRWDLFSAPSRPVHVEAVRGQFIRYAHKGYNWWMGNVVFTTEFNIWQFGCALGHLSFLCTAELIFIRHNYPSVVFGLICFHFHVCPRIFDVIMSSCVHLWVLSLLRPGLWNLFSSAKSKWSKTAWESPMLCMSVPVSNTTEGWRTEYVPVRVWHVFMRPDALTGFKRFTIAWVVR